MPDTPPKEGDNGKKNNNGLSMTNTMMISNIITMAITLTACSSMLPN